MTRKAESVNQNRQKLQLSSRLPLPEVICKSHSLQCRPCCKTLIINVVPNNAEIMSMHLWGLKYCSQQPALSHSGRGSLILPSGMQPWSCPSPASRHPHLSPRFERCLQQHGWAGGAASQLAALHSFVCPGDNHFKAEMRWVRLPGEETATMTGRKDLGHSDT